MATIAEIERERVNGRKYVTYDLKALHPDIPDSIDPNNEWFKYWTNSINGGASRKNIFDQNMVNHDLYRCDPGKISFKTIEKVLRDKNLADEKTISYFRKLTTINDKSDKTCKLMIYAGGRINWEPLLNDIGSARSKSDVSKILQTLTAQVRSAAIQGTFSMVYQTAHTMGKNPAIMTGDDKVNEANILKAFNKTMHGDKKQDKRSPLSQPLDIPVDPSVEYSDLNAVLNVIAAVKDKKGLDPKQVYKELIDPIETKFNTIKSASKSRTK